MSEQTTTTQQEVQENVQESVQQPVQEFNPFSDNSWSESKPDFTQAGEQQAPEQTATTSPDTQEEYEEEIVDADEWLKTQFGWENADTAKAEIEELRKLREGASSQAEIEFANEQSAKFFKLLQDGKEDELYSYLENKKRIDRLTASDLNNSTAAEIIKLNMAQKYKDLTPNEIEYKFNKQFGIPSKPVQRDVETDEEYQDRLSSWESQVRDVETEMMIEAKLAKPELERFKSELILPDIQFESGNQPAGPTQEELDAQVKMIEGFKQGIQSTLQSFDGFSVAVKDEEVEIPLSYSISDDEKGTVAEQLNRFADSNFDANSILAERWLKEDGRGGYELNTNQMIRDLALLNSDGRVAQKFANDAAAKRLSEHIRKTSNVTVSSRTPQNTFNPESKSQLEKEIDFIWKNG